MSEEEATSRRDFLRKMGIGAAAAAVARPLIGRPQIPRPVGRTLQQRAHSLSQTVHGGLETLPPRLRLFGPQP